MILHALTQWSWLILARLAGILSGFLMVALAIPFRVPAVSLSDGRAIVNLPTGASVLWVLADNTVIQADADELREALALAGAEQARLWTA